MKNIISAILYLLIFGCFPSCVNEWPNGKKTTYSVSLNIHCDTDWMPKYEMDYTRALNDLLIDYQFMIYHSGHTDFPVMTFSHSNYDLSRSDFSVNIDLSAGEYDVYVWSHVCHSNTGKALFYDSSDFAAITHLLPYKGNSDYKDAFRGMTSFTIEKTTDPQKSLTETIIMKRPLSRYEFVAIDFNEFIDKETSRGKLRSISSRDSEWDYNSRDLQEELLGYQVRIIYPLFMPAVHDIFSNRPYDSWTGVSFNGEISPVSSTQASLGFDYVMMHEDESSVQVSMEIYDKEGNKIGGIPTLSLPTLRDRSTVVYGRFLTSDENSGVVIDPDFQGQFNIPYN